MILLAGGGTLPASTWGTLATHLPRGGRVVVVTHSNPRPRRTGAYVRARLRVHGVRNVCVVGHLSRLPSEADALWFCGGDTAAYLASLRPSRAGALARSILSNGGVVGGTSAGARILGTRGGLGLVNACVGVHGVPCDGSGASLVLREGEVVTIG